MLNVIVFVIPMAPVGKGRPRFSRRGAYTPKATKVAEAFIKKHAKPLFDDATRFNGPVGMEIALCHAIPKSWSKRARESALNGLTRPTVKPDMDNVEKLILDALNGIAFCDDKQVVEKHTVKIYAETPMIEVRIWAI